MQLVNCFKGTLEEYNQDKKKYSQNGTIFFATDFPVIYVEDMAYGFTEEILEEYFDGVKDVTWEETTYTIKVTYYGKEELDIVLKEVTTELSGLMSAEDKKRLDDLYKLVVTDNMQQTLKELAVESKDKSVKVTPGTEGNKTDLSVNIDGSTLKKDETTGALKVDSSALVQYTGQDAIQVSEASPDKKISLKIGDGEKILSQNGTGLVSTLNASFEQKYASGDKTVPALVFKGNGEQVITAVDMSPIVNNRMVKSATLEGNKLKLVFSTLDGDIPVEVDFSKFVDTYTSGNGISITDKTVSVKVKEGEKFLTVGTDGLATKDIETVMDSKAKAAADAAKAEVLQEIGESLEDVYTKEESDNRYVGKDKEGEWVTLNTVQTISGAKTFSTAPVFSGTTVPFSVSSNNMVANLNADMLDGLHNTAFARTDQDPKVDLDTVNGFGIMSNPANDYATQERHYPENQAGTLFYGNAASKSANQIYGTYYSNRWYARGGCMGPTRKTAWREFVFQDTLDVQLGHYVKKSGDAMTGILTISVEDISSPLAVNSTSSIEVGTCYKMSGISKGWCGYNKDHGAILYNYKANSYLGIKDDNTPSFNNYTLWHAGNDGTGSTLDADLLDGHHGDYYLPKEEAILWYGIEWDTTVSSPKCTRIGNMDLHRILPVQSAIRGCLLNDDGIVVKYLDPTNWESETRDGTKGQVMVEIPEHWRKFETDGNKRRVKLSTLPLPGFHRVPKVYVSAYESALNRTTNILASVVNDSIEYRGGNNTSDWDNTYRSLLGRPATNVNRTNFRTYAHNRGKGWVMYMYHIHKTLCWLYYVEYANLNSQDNYSSSKDSNGFMQGGLGNGVTTLTNEEWNSYNNINPFVPCGHTDSIGNGTGMKDYAIPNGSNTTLKTVSVPRYRGIENPFGHVWKWCDGINVQIHQDSDSDKTSKVYVLSDIRGECSDTGYDGYTYVGDKARTNGYVKELIFGEGGEIMPLTVNGSSTTYFCDYHWTNISAATTLWGVLLGASESNGAAAGLVCASSDLAPSYASAYIGSRLCFIPYSEPADSTWIIIP